VGRTSQDEKRLRAVSAFDEAIIILLCQLETISVFDLRIDVYRL